MSDIFFANKQGLDTVYVDYVGEIERCYEAFKASKFKSFGNEYLLDLSTKTVMERKRDDVIRDGNRAMSDIADILNYPKDYFGTEQIAWAIDGLVEAIKSIGDEFSPYQSRHEPDNEKQCSSILETLRAVKNTKDGG